jgi:hypothetical protein
MLSTSVYTGLKSLKNFYFFNCLFDIGPYVITWTGQNQLQFKICWFNCFLVYMCSRVCYNERCYKRTNATANRFINKIRMAQQTQTLQRTRRKTIGRRSTLVRMTCRAFPLWLERQSSPLLPFVRFSYQFSSAICLFVQCVKVNLINFILFLHTFFILYYIFLFKWLCWMVTFLWAVGLERITPKYIYFNVW